MESKTLMSSWIYSTAELYGVSVKNIQAVLDHCKEFYGNKLDFKQQKDYVRATLDKVCPMKYFQFTGEVYTEEDWLEYIPKWFKEYYETSPYCIVWERGDRQVAEGETVLVEYPEIEFIDDFFQTRSTKAHVGDYVIYIDRVGIKPVPIDIFELTYKKDEESLYEYLKYGIISPFEVH